MTTRTLSRTLAKVFVSIPGHVSQTLYVTVGAATRSDIEETFIMTPLVSNECGLANCAILVAAIGFILII